jgi:N-acyl-D-amino-acid deacylase
MSTLVIRNGLVVDGTGAPAREADVVIDGDLIVDVVAPGKALHGSARVIDADGLMLTPGFVDIHTHYDGQVSWDPWLTPSSWHGVTTVVGGNCGVGFAPAKADRHDWLIALMEGVEDIPGAAMAEGLAWGWESFPEYLDVIAQREHVIDFGFQLAHGPLRAYVMGDRGAANEPATADDLITMEHLASEALAAGAMGVSTSRTSLHKSRDGEFVPGTFADVDELFALARALRSSPLMNGGRASMGGARRGRVFQLAMEHPEVPSQFGWMREFARISGGTVSLNLNQTDHAPDVWPEVIRELDSCASDGLSVVAQVAGRAVGVLECLEGSIHPFVTHQAWQPLRRLGHSELRSALADPGFRERLISEPPKSLTPVVDLLTHGWRRMYPVGVGNINYEPDPFVDSIEAICARTGQRPAEVALDALLAHDGHGMLFVPLFNYSDGDYRMLEQLHQHPSTRMGLSDAGAHCGSICDGGMPTFMLTHWTRDRTRGPKLGLEHVVRRQTSETASLFGLYDRGVVAPGYRADINVIDYERLGFSNASMAYDFPANARRLVQRGFGYAATISHGVSIVENDEFTGELPGQLLRGPSS